MNWIVEAYSNVYSTAMMQDVKRHDHAASAKDSAKDRRPTFFGRLVRR